MRRTVAGGETEDVVVRVGLVRDTATRTKVVTGAGAEMDMSSEGAVTASETASAAPQQPPPASRQTVDSQQAWASSDETSQGQTTRPVASSARTAIPVTIVRSARESDMAFN